MRTEFIGNENEKEKELKAAHQGREERGKAAHQGRGGPQTRRGRGGEGPHLRGREGSRVGSAQSLHRVAARSTALGWLGHRWLTPQGRSRQGQRDTGRHGRLEGEQEPARAESQKVGWGQGKKHRIQKAAPQKMKA